MKQTSISDLKQERASRNGLKTTFYYCDWNVRRHFNYIACDLALPQHLGPASFEFVFFDFCLAKNRSLFCFVFRILFCLLMCFFYYFIVFLIFLRRQPQGEGIHPPTGGGRQLTVRSLVLGKGVYLTLGAFSYPRNMGCRSFNHMCSYNKHHI